jgi:HPt (histidine-containing phosphotransfer) domain-containing protein
MQSSEIWDDAQLASSLGVMKQIMPKLIETFLSQTTKILETLDSQSNEQLLLTAHSLKGSAGQLCCKRLSNTAAKIEQELKLQCNDDTAERRALLHEDLNAARALMSEYLRQRQTLA